MYMGKEITHKHVNNSVKLHFDGSQMWYYSHTYGKWMVSDMIPACKIVELNKINTK